jgi:hypothetical protein
MNVVLIPYEDARNVFLMFVLLSGNFIYYFRFGSCVLFPWCISTSFLSNEGFWV